MEKILDAIFILVAIAEGLLALAGMWIGVNNLFFGG
jgi:hypothetical protein